MAPTPQEYVKTKQDEPLAMTGEQVVISGMSGLYPNSPHVKKLEQILYNKENPISDENCRWTFSHPGVSNHTGKVPGLDRFDGQFFKVHYRLGRDMEPMSRKILEQAYQAIYDAGVSPECLSGKKVGVYIGSCFSETEKFLFYREHAKYGFGMSGCSKTMFANRISYWLNARGPSMAIDEACCSSISALEQAYQAMVRGDCEAALVGSCNLCLHPQASVHYGRILPLCQDGKTKSFDSNADGLAKSEAINMLFLQKAEDAKRVYAEVVYVKNEYLDVLRNESGGPIYGFNRDTNKLAEFLKQFYKQAKVLPQAVEYIEAFGSAVPDADKAELEAIEEVFCKNKQDPLLVGSVMSNIGYGEAASGISAITKVLLGYHNGLLAANLHCESPRRDVTALREGRIKIVTDHRPFDRSYTAVNSISTTGVNAHVLLHGHYKPKDSNRYKSNIPRLVNISGRQESAVQKIINSLKTRPVDPEELALLHNIHQTRISGHMGRGYVILDTNKNNETVTLKETVSYFDDSKPPLWFVYSGMGSQWTGMGAQLMRIPVFAAAIERCNKVLAPKGIDIVHIISSPDKSTFDNILNSFVGIAAIQIGLTDVLTSLGIVPDNIIGHSVGELGCGYADGCLTAEETILAAYSRGLVSVQTPFIKGSMAAVGMGYQQIVNLIPPGLEVACHNGPESCTISGPAEAMTLFVTLLTAQGIFAKEVPCSNIAYHSRYIAEAGPGLLKYLSDVIKDPRPRSQRWVSTSVPQERWGEDNAKYCSAFYHTNNLLSPVLFEETSRLIPANAVTVEIAPHGLLQAILMRSLPDCKHIPLTRREHADNAFMVLDAVGKLYLEGYLPEVQALYPPVQFPVSTGTPMLSHQVEWAHSEIWTVPLFVSAYTKKAASCTFLISTHDNEYSFLRGNVIAGKNLYPYSAALVAAWDTLAMSLDLKRKQCPVEFCDVQLYAQPLLLKHKPLGLSVSLHRSNGRFEIMNEDRILASGYIFNKLSDTTKDSNQPNKHKQTWEYTSDDVYQMLYQRDYSYSGDFRSIHKVNKALTEAHILWNGNWVTCLDGILQLNALRTKHDSIVQCFQIKSISIDIQQHATTISNEAGCSVILAQVSDIHNKIRCGGITVTNIQTRKLPVVDDLVLMKDVKFVPRFQANIDEYNALQVYMQIVSENINRSDIKLVEIVNNNFSSIFKEVKRLLDDIPGVTVSYQQTTRDKIQSVTDMLLKADMVLVQNLACDGDLGQKLYQTLHPNTFLINKQMSKSRSSAVYRIVSSENLKHADLELIKWRPTHENISTTVVTIRNRSDLSLLTSSRKDLLKPHKLVILSSYPPLPGLKELVKSWRNESDMKQIFLVMISDESVMHELPELDLVYNVLKDDVWGGEYVTTWHGLSKAGRGVSLHASRVGDLDSLHWVNTSEPTGLGVPVTVHYAALNDVNVKNAMGVLPSMTDSTISTMDFSGFTDSGERVMGIVESGAANSRVLARPELLWPVPAHWSLEDAATVPFTYAHAFYILQHKTEFRQGYKDSLFNLSNPSEKTRVLVHGATGALGQALIFILLAHSCEIFATVSDMRKKRFLMQLFPQIKESHIGNSRDESFSDMVLTSTNGEGCNLVFSCLRSSNKNACLKCLASSGIMVDAVQVPNQENYSFGMFSLTMARNYCTSDFSSIFSNKDVKDMKNLQMLISEGISKGYVQPLSRVSYAPDEVSRAFRLLAASRHRGRVLIRLQDQLPVVAEPRLSCSTLLRQVVICDEQSLGLQFAERLIQRGATTLLLHCTSPTNNTLRITNSWKSQGLNVEISSEDLTDNKNIVDLLSENNNLDSIDGIYVIATDVNDSDSDKWAEVVDKLDSTSRKLCTSLRYFAIASVGHSIGQRTCFRRVKKGLPCTILNLPAIKNPKKVASTESLSRRSAINAMEKAFGSWRNVLMAYPKTVNKTTLLQEIAHLANITISDDTPDCSSLLDLGIDLTTVPLISSFLRNTHNLAFLEESIPSLTVQRIKELNEAILPSCAKAEELHGLSCFFRFVDSEELQATTDMVFLPTLTNSSTITDNEFDVTKTYLFIIPGLEGHYGRFHTMCERLKLPAVVLQPGLDLHRESHKETAERYAKTLMKQGCVHEHFYLLGYENGVLVALEVAKILEDHGFIGTVYCLGGTPEEFHSLLEEQLVGISTDEELQDAVILHMFALMMGHTEGIAEALHNVTNWEQKVEISVRTLLGQVHHSAQYARNLFEAAYSRVKTARSYSWQSKKLKSKLVLLHASSLQSEQSAATSLQRYSLQPVAVHQLEETMPHAPLDLRCSAFINNHLDKNVLNNFEESNICESYKFGNDSFVMHALSDNVEE